MRDTPVANGPAAGAVLLEGDGSDRRAVIGAVLVLTDEGTCFLDVHGRRETAGRLREHLKQYLDPVSLPRRWRYVERLIKEFDLPPLPEGVKPGGVVGWTDEVAHRQVEISLAHPICLIANALGSPPKDVIDQAHAHGVKVAALAYPTSWDLRD